MRKLWGCVVVALVLLVLLAGCGGGDSGGDISGTMVGPLGGTAQSADGNCTAEFPPGALDQMTTITLQPTTTVPTQQEMIANTAYRCGPQSTDFNTAVTLTIKYAQSAIAVGVDESELDIARVVGGAWQRIPSSVADPNANEVTAPIAGFSTFAILGSPVVPSEEYVFENKWGTQGTSSSEFGPMGGIAYQSATVYVTDMVPINIERIQRFGQDSSFLGQCQGWDARAGAPGGLTVDASGDIYTSIADDVFTKIDSTCGPILAHEAADLGLAKFRPSDVAVDSQGNIYIADMVNSQIIKLDASGQYVATIGSYGGGDGQFNGVGGIAIGPNDNIYASDHLGDRMQKLDSTGTFINAWGTSGEDQGEFHNPRGIDVDTNGDVYVADSVGNRVQKFDTDGNFITEFGENGTGDGQFTFPTDVAVEPDGSAVYVLDVLNYRVQKFVKQ